MPVIVYNDNYFQFVLVRVSQNVEVAFFTTALEQIKGKLFYKGLEADVKMHINPCVEFRKSKHLSSW